MLGKCRGADGAVVDLDSPKCRCQHYQAPGYPPAIMVNRGCPIHCPNDGHFASKPDGTLVDLDEVWKLAPHAPELLAALKACAAELACMAEKSPAGTAARALIARLEGK